MNDLERNWRCRYCGLAARSLPISGTGWVDILVHDYHPYAVEVCPDCWCAALETLRKLSDGQGADGTQNATPAQQV